MLICRNADWVHRQKKVGNSFSGVITKLFNNTMQKLSAELSTGGPHGISEKEGSEVTPSFASPKISDVFETITYETETWLKSRDRDFIKHSKTQDLKLEIETKTRDWWIVPKFFKNVVISSKFNFFRISWHFPTCFGCFLPANTTEKNSLSCRSFTKPFLCDIQRLKTISCDRDLKPSRPRLAKIELETESRDSITA